MEDLGQELRVSQEARMETRKNSVVAQFANKLSCPNMDLLALGDNELPNGHTVLKTAHKFRKGIQAKITFTFEFPS